MTLCQLSGVNPIKIYTLSMLLKEILGQYFRTLPPKVIGLFFFGVWNQPFYLTPSLGVKSIVCLAQDCQTSSVFKIVSVYP
jgi:hypothetical protein